MALGVHPIWRHECVSLGLDKDILLTEDGEPRRILETTSLQGTKQIPEEPLRADEAAALILEVSDLRELGVENEIVDEKDGSPPGWQRLKKTKRELGLDAEGSVPRTDVLQTHRKGGNAGALC